MNHHLRFAAVSARTRGGNLAALALCACAAPFLTSCQSTNTQLLSVSESVPPKLAKNKPFLHVQCYFFTAPDDFQLLENTKGAHVAGIYSPQDGDKLVASLIHKRGFNLVSSPTLTTRQGAIGKLEVIQEFIYPTEYSPPEVPKDFNPKTLAGEADVFPVTPATPAKFETTNLGIMADFKGRKNSRGEIDFEIDLMRRTFLGFINYGSPITAPARTALGRSVEVVITENSILMPVIDTKRVATTMTLSDGHYLALGGLKPSTLDPEVIKNHPPAGAAADAHKNFFALIKVTAISGQL
jgi:hypothetical protein